MKNRICVCLFLITLGFTHAQDQGAEIEVEVVNIEHEKGKILIGLYNAEGHWLKKIYKGTYGKIANGKASATFSGISKGVYAISVFHDENNNGELDTLLGIPTEPTGASNDAPARFGPPAWVDAKFEVKEANIKHVIHL